MKILFESTGEMFGTNQKFMDSLPVKYIPGKLRNVTMGIPTKSCPFTLMLPDGKAGVFFFITLQRKKFACICVGKSDIGTDGEFKSAKIIVFLGNFEKGKDTTWSILYLYERLAKDSRVSNRSRKTNSSEFSLVSQLVRSGIKKSFCLPRFLYGFSKIA